MTNYGNHIILSCTVFAQERAEYNLSALSSPGPKLLESRLSQGVKKKNH